MIKNWIIGILLIFCLGISVSWAQTNHPVFSASLGGGSGGVSYRNGTVVRRANGIVSQTSQKRRAVPHKLVLNYSADQILLGEEQAAKLMPVIQRIQAGQVQSLEVIGIGRDPNTVYHRQNALRQMLMSYAPNLTPYFREITGAAVLDINNNTVEFIEYR